MDSFDYVIVGAGSAGCTLAARLTEDPDVSVCLLEAGGTHKHWSVFTPGIAIWNMVLGKRNWQFETEPQEGLNGRKGYQPRGKVLGGSSSINAMIYMMRCYPILKKASTAKRAQTTIMAKAAR
jgi:choline dehydrogenase-like flavoprotein